jgi:hypothetical protein
MRMAVRGEERCVIGKREKERGAGDQQRTF